MSGACAALFLLATAFPAGAQQYWSGTGSWDASTPGWSATPGGPYSGTWASGGAIFEGTGGTVTLSGSLTATGLTFAASGYSLTGGTSLTLGGTVATGSNNASIASPLAGGGLITKTGAGTLTLSGSQTHTGGLAINGGTVKASSFAFIQATGGSVSFDGGILEYSGASSTSMSTTRFTAITANAGGATFHIPNAAAVVDVQRGITGAGGVTKTGAGTLILSSDTNTFAGTLTISAGTLRLGASNRIPNSATVTLGDATLATGASTGYSETVGTLNLSGSATIALGTGSHTLTFAASNGQSWSGSALTITGWTGTAGQSGTAGRIFVGSSATGLTGDQLAVITFSGFNPGAALLATGELVPAGQSGGGGTPEGTSVIYQSPFVGALGFGSTWIDGQNSGNTVNGASTQLRVGRQGTDAASVARGLVRWDVSNLEGVFTAITGLQLELTLASPTTVATTLQVYAVGQDNAGWSETDSTKSRKLQSLAYPWTGSADADGFPALAGGPVLATQLLPAGLAAGTKVTIALNGTSSELLALVTDWIEGRRSGLLLRLADESASSSALAFQSGSAATLSVRPKLTVTYTPGHAVWSTTDATTYLGKYLGYNSRSFDAGTNLVSQGGLAYTRYSLEYAYCLLATGRSEHIATAEAVLSAVLAQQYNNSGDPLQHGYLKQYTTEPLGSYNGAMHDFGLGAALRIRLRHYDQLGSTAQTNLNTLIQRAAAWTNVNRNPTNITNQETGTWYNLLVAGQIYANATWTAQGNALFANGGAQILANEGIHEFNSPTYTRVSAAHLRKLTHDLSDANATVRDNCRRMLGWVWAQTARHYHRPSRQWAGPMTRTYDETQFDESTRFNETYAGLPKSQTTEHGRDRVPAEFLAYFTDPLPAARENSETFVKGPAVPSESDTVVNHWADHGVLPIVGTTYHHPGFSLGSLNFGHMGYDSSGTKRPLIQLWGDATAQGSSGLALLTLMKTGSGALIETARPLLFSAQSNGDVLFGLTWSFNPNNDSPRSTSSTFTASDLRIRFLFSGAAASGTFPAPSGLLAATSRTTGGITTLLQCLHADFPGCTPTWSASGDHLDLIIYSGTERTFDLAAMARFSAAFVMRTGTAGGVTPPDVAVTAAATATSMRSGSLSLIYPTQPDTIHVLARWYRELLTASDLGTPSSFAALPNSPTANDLYWTDLASAETGFTIERRLSSGGAWSTLATLPTDSVAYLDETVSPNTQYDYRIRAFDSVNTSNWSTTATIVSLGTANPSPVVWSQPASTTQVVPVTFTNGAAVTQNFTITPPPTGGNYTATTYGAADNPVYSAHWDDTVPTTGTALSLGDDTYSPAVNLGFSAPYYGRTMTRAVVCSNGFVALGTDDAIGVTPGGANAPFTNFWMPSKYARRDSLALLWDDLYPDASSGVYWKRADTNSDGQIDTFIVHYENVRLYSNTTRFTAQLQIKSSGEVLYLYKDLPSALNSYTIGLQGTSDPTVDPPGIQLAYNTSYASSGMAIRFTPPVTWLAVAPTTLSLAPGASGTLNLTLNSEGLTNGNVLSLDLPVTGDAPAQPAFTLPVTLSVSSAASPVFFTHPSDATSPAQGTVTFTAAATGSPTPTLQWQRDNGTGGAWANIPGATQSTYSLTPSLADNSARFRCLATNTGGSTASNVATITVQTSYAAWADGIAWNGADAAPTADPDGDGVNNLLEYALGTAPGSPASGPALESQIANLKLQISFLRARPELTYIVQGSTDLVTWTDLATNPGNVGETATVTDTLDLGSTPRRFLRLKVVTP